MNLSARVDVRLETEDLKDLIQRANEEGRSVSGMARELIRNGLKKPFFTVLQVEGNSWKEVKKDDDL